MKCPTQGHLQKWGTVSPSPFPTRPLWSPGLKARSPEITRRERTGLTVSAGVGGQREGEGKVLPLHTRPSHVLPHVGLPKASRGRSLWSPVHKRGRHLWNITFTYLVVHRQIGGKAKKRTPVNLRLAPMPPSSQRPKQMQGLKAWLTGKG